MIGEVGSDTGAKNPRVVRFDHGGAPKAFGGSNLAKNRRRYSARQTPGDLKWRMHRIHCIHLTAGRGRFKQRATESVVSALHIEVNTDMYF